MKPRQRALREGRKTYFTGKPCKNGHIAERDAQHGNCRECTYDRIKRQRAANPEKFRQRKRDWRKTQAGKDARRAAKRRRRRQEQQQGCRCCTKGQIKYALRKARRDGRTADHIIPLSKGGTHCRFNIQSLTVEENSLKNDRYDPLIEGIQYLQNLGLA